MRIIYRYMANAHQIIYVLLSIKFQSNVNWIDEKEYNEQME